MAKNRKHFFVILGAAGVLGLIFVVSIFGSIHTEDNQRTGNIAAVSDAANNAYGLHLSEKQAINLLGKPGLNGNNDAEQFGTTLLVRGSTVQRIQLVHPDNRWLIIDAGTRSELPHD